VCTASAEPAQYWAVIDWRITTKSESRQGLAVTQGGQERVINIDLLILCLGGFN
jgi:hypothetical protein